MMDLNVTNEEKEALKAYIENDYEAITQMLVCNSETDIALLSEEVENTVVSINYDREHIIEYLKTIKLIYSLILKTYIKNKMKVTPSIYRATNISEIERIKSELFIDRMLVGTTDEVAAKNKYATAWNRPALMNIILDKNIPYINIKEYLKGKKYDKDILISPFTKIKFIEEKDEQVIEKNSKTIKVFDVELEKQYLDELTDKERNGLFQFVLENAFSIKRKIEECIGLEKENVTNFENIRKLEQLLSKYENSMEEKEADSDYSDAERLNDYDDIKRINHELEEIKNTSTHLFELRKENIDFINIWKRNIAVYMIAECREIEKNFETELAEVDETYENIEKVEEIQNSEEIVESVKDEKEAEIEDTKENKQENTEKVNDSENVIDKITTEVVENAINETEIVESIEETKIVEITKKEVTENEACRKILEESKENVESAQKLLVNVNNLILKQQNHAKIAGNVGASYSALNNAFEMRKASERLLEMLQTFDLQIKAFCDSKENSDEIKIERISKNNIEISTLFNYLNNPKIVAQNSRATRFDEMAIIEENELKRCIAERIREIRGEAELKKLRDDLEYIETKGTFQKFIGIFTGNNKLDDIRKEQIDIRQNAIRRTLARKMDLAYNYSIHELMAEIKMFINENEDDELIEDDVLDLKAISDELKRNFVIMDSKVSAIVENKEGKRYPVDNRRLSKGELLEIDTYKFLNKYKYDIQEKYQKEPEYQDTMASEIVRIIEYMNASKVF